MNLLAKEKSRKCKTILKGIERESLKRFKRGKVYSRRKVKRLSTCIKKRGPVKAMRNEGLKTKRF